MQYTMMMFARSENAQRFDRSYPAMLQAMPNAVTKTQSRRRTVMKEVELEIRVPEISEKVTKPMTQVYAKRQKQMETMTMTKVYRRSGVSAWMESRNFG